MVSNKFLSGDAHPVVVDSALQLVPVRVGWPQDLADMLSETKQLQQLAGCDTNVWGPRFQWRFQGQLQAEADASNR